jgi:hypothetical protein
MSRFVGPETAKEPSMRSPELRFTGMDMYCPASRVISCEKLVACMVFVVVNPQLKPRLLNSKREQPKSKILRKPKYFADFICLLL